VEWSDTPHVAHFGHSTSLHCRQRSSRRQHASARVSQRPLMLSRVPMPSQGPPYGGYHPYMHTSSHNRRSSSPVLENVALHAVRAGLASPTPGDMPYSQPVGRVDFDHASRAFAASSSPSPFAPAHSTYVNPGVGAHAHAPCTNHQHPSLTSHAAAPASGSPFGVFSVNPSTVTAPLNVAAPPPTLFVPSHPFMTPAHPRSDLPAASGPFNPNVVHLDDLEGGVGPIRTTRSTKGRKPRAPHALNAATAVLPAGAQKKKAAAKKAALNEARAAAAAQPDQVLPLPVIGGVGPVEIDVELTYAYRYVDNFSGYARHCTDLDSGRSVVDTHDDSKGQVATDVWWFMWPIEHSDRPDGGLGAEAPGARKTSKPDTKVHPFVCCRYCLCVRFVFLSLLSANMMSVTKVSGTHGISVRARPTRSATIW
jgi:hypothetical protein